MVVLGIYIDVARRVDCAFIDVGFNFVIESGIGDGNRRAQWHQKHFRDISRDCRNAAIGFDFRTILSVDIDRADIKCWIFYSGVNRIS